jgi:hypothetical protein
MKELNKPYTVSKRYENQDSIKQDLINLFKSLDLESKIKVIENEQKRILKN